MGYYHYYCKRFLKQKRSFKFKILFTILLIFIAISFLFACCISCVGQNLPLSRVSLSEANVNTLLNATVAFVQPAETSDENLGFSSVSWEGPICGGFFVDRIHIVSAAHCFRREIRVEVFPGIFFSVPSVVNPVGQRAFFLQYREIEWLGDDILVTPTEAIVTSWNEENDIAILRVVREDFVPRAFLRISSRIPLVGEEVFHVGHPIGVPWTFTNGIISAVLNNGSTTILQVNAPISPGCSGGPLVNSRGEVVGLANGIMNRGDSHSHLAFFVSSNTIIRSLMADVF